MLLKKKKKRRNLPASNCIKFSGFDKELSISSALLLQITKNCYWVAVKRHLKHFSFNLHPGCDTFQVSVISAEET